MFPIIKMNPIAPNETTTLKLFSQFEEQKNINEISKGIIDGVMAVLDKQLKKPFKEEVPTIPHSKKDKELDLEL